MITTIVIFSVVILTIVLAKHYLEKSEKNKKIDHLNKELLDVNINEKEKEDCSNTVINGSYDKDCHVQVPTVEMQLPKFVESLPKEVRETGNSLLQEVEQFKEKFIETKNNNTKKKVVKTPIVKSKQVKLEEIKSNVKKSNSKNNTSSKKTNVKMNGTKNIKNKVSSKQVVLLPKMSSKVKKSK